MILARLLTISLLLFVAAPLVGFADEVNGQVKSVSGDARLVLDGKSEPITVDTPIAPGSKITTGEGTTLVINWMPGATSVIASHSRVTVRSLSYSTDGGMPNRTIWLNVTRGTITSHLNHNDGKSDFRIMTPKGEAVAVGTDWRIIVLPNGKVFVACARGFVAISGRVINTSVKAGYIVDISTTGALDALTPDQLVDIINVLVAAGVPFNGNAPAVVDINAGNGGSITLSETPLTRRELMMELSR